MISLNLFELRKARGITQSYLAEVLGVSFQTISRWETGVVVPDVKYVIAMAKFFGVTTDQILGLQPLECDYFSRMTETSAICCWIIMTEEGRSARSSGKTAERRYYL